MVKAAKTTSAKPKKRRAGRPPGPPDDVRTERVAFRAHPDLDAELRRIARENGEPKSGWIERMVITVINDSAGYRVLDAIGKYIPYDDETPRLAVPGRGPLHLMPRPRYALTEDDLRPPMPTPKPPKR